MTKDVLIMCAISFGLLLIWISYLLYRNQKLSNDLKLLEK